MAGRAFPGRRIVSCEAVAGGARNLVYRVSVEGMADRFGVRLYRHDRDAWRKEADLHRLIAARVPVPEIVFAASPGVVMRWIEGETYREIKSRRDAGEIAECARAMGEVLARIGEFRFPAAGIIGPGLAAGAGPVADGPDVVPRMIEMFLAAPAARARIGAEGAGRVCEFAWARSRELAALDSECRLVHSDFGSPNIVLHRPGGAWEVAAVLDWEFAFSGSPLCDVGHALRYEREDRPMLEPHFSEAFRAAGGDLPGNWRDLARTLDLTALCEMLSRAALPDWAAAEILELIERIVS